MKTSLPSSDLQRKQLWTWPILLETYVRNYAGLTRMKCVSFGSFGNYLVVVLSSNVGNLCYTITNFTYSGYLSEILHVYLLLDVYNQAKSVLLFGFHVLSGDVRYVWVRNLCNGRTRLSMYSIVKGWVQSFSSQIQEYLRLITKKSCWKWCVRYGTESIRHPLW